MWSFVQHRQLQKQAAVSVSNNTHSNNNDINNYQTGYDISNGASTHTTADGENPEPPSGLHGSKKDNKIYIQTTSDDDPLDPRNWPLLNRSKNIAILAYLIFVQAWAGAAESTANSTASREEGHSKVAENLTICHSVGRNPTYLVPSFCFLLFVLGAALAPTFGGRLACRFFMGLFASSTLTINGSSVKDQFRSVKRAFVFPVLAWVNVAVPMLAPIASGWIVENPNLGWRWTEWITLIISGPAVLLAFFFLPETYLPLLLDWKAAGLRRATGDKRYVSYHAESGTFKERLRKGVKMPLKFFFTEPVIAVLGVYLIWLYVLLFTFLSGFDYIFKDTYGLSTGLTGSCFGAIAAGATAFTLLAPGLYSLARRKTEHVRGARVTPEFRLRPAIVAGPLLPISLFWLGWGNYSSISIWCSLGACFLFGAVTIAIYVSSYEYITDSYGEHSAMALSSITFMRYMIAGAMVMASRPMYSGLGVHWTMTLLGCIAVILAPAPLVFWKLGPKLRKRSPYADDPNENE
ncbi:major facilitator superfamily domain-containing protein [Staphylotrichum tortipilum]|uniref:Major facilitator superfamily domain-containing protein n=1 Tax=Staphylotrichum tortipilum TaxID=2831512 RepID=A0AAN6MG42_9PEZI|nr:major facilitator superfamily domain-containing protein [Staphylotrichum longicolle]